MTPRAPRPVDDMATRVRNYPWERTALGAIDSWPQSLRTAVDIVLGSRLPMVMAWGPDAQLIYNDAYAVFAGGRHPFLLGLNVRAAWPEVAEFNQHVLEVTLAGGSLSYHDQPLVLFRNGDPEHVWLDLEYNPLRDESGTPRGFLAVVVETTSRVLAESQREAANEAYRRVHEQIELALDAGTVLGTWVWHVPADRVVADARFARTFSLEPARVVEGMPLAHFLAPVHPDDRPVLEARIADCLREGGDFRCQYRVPTDAGYRWIEAVGRCEFGKDGKPARFPGLLLDVHERKLAEQQQRVLINELNHRVKNTLAIVQSLATQSFQGARSVEQAAEVFNARLISLSRAHDVLTRSHWQNALLGELVEQMARSHEFGGQSRFRIAGPQVRLSPQHALSFSMALHELATNAVKYGALGEAGGRVYVTWSVEADTAPPRLHLVWRETGGPPVSPPLRRGFGTRLVERSLGLSMEGRVAFDYRPEGLLCRMDTVLPEPPPSPTPAPPPADVDVPW